MGNESSRNARVREAGKYNIVIGLHFRAANSNDMMEERIVCKSWEPRGPFLALTLFSGHLRIINISQYYGYTVSGIPEDELAKLEAMN